MTVIITHRGINNDVSVWPPEGSIESLESMLKSGWGIEFDPNPTHDDNFVVLHDPTLTRVTNGEDQRSIIHITTQNTSTIKLDSEYTIATLESVLSLISKYHTGISAMHLKAHCQNIHHINLLIEHLKKFPQVIDLLIMFDLKPEWAKYIRTQLPDAHIAASVAHSFDIERYGKNTGNTLISVGDAIKYGPKDRKLYDWVWLDEWDLKSKSGRKKHLYTPGVFARLKRARYKIALVTPELHTTSPSLLAGESHPDGFPRQKLLKRMQEILKLKPDTICTDHPHTAQSMIDDEML